MCPAPANTVSPVIQPHGPAGDPHPSHPCAFPSRTTNAHAIAKCLQARLKMEATAVTDWTTGGRRNVTYSARLASTTAAYATRSRIPCMPSSSATLTTGGLLQAPMAMAHVRPRPAQTTCRAVRENAGRRTPTRASTVPARQMAVPIVRLVTMQDAHHT